MIYDKAILKLMKGFWVYIVDSTSQIWKLSIAHDAKLTYR